MNKCSDHCEDPELLTTATPLLGALAPIIAALGLVAVFESHPLRRRRRSVFAKVRKLVKRGYELEGLGRELAADRDGLVSARDRALAVDLYELYAELEEAFYMVAMLEPSLVPRRLAGLLIAGRDAMKSFATWVCPSMLRHPGFRRRDMLSAVMSMDELRSHVEKPLKIFEDEVKGATGRPCIWVLNNVQDLSSYTYSAYLNDLIACHHAAMDFISIQSDPGVVRWGKRVYELMGNPRLVEGCVLWSDVLDRLVNYEIYDANDYSECYCIVRESSCVVRTGVLPGHNDIVHVVLLDEGRLQAIYYDTREMVHRVLMLLARDLGLEVVDHVEGFSTTVELPVERICRFFKQILPFMTSMYSRIEEPMEMWVRLIGREELSTVIETVRDGVERERMLVKAAWEKLGLKC
jgi:hypothetical protein